MIQIYFKVLLLYSLQLISNDKLLIDLYLTILLLQTEIIYFISYQILTNPQLLYIVSIEQLLYIFLRILQNSQFNQFLKTMNLQPLPLEGSKFLLDGLILGKFKISNITHQCKIQFRVVWSIELALVVIKQSILDIVKLECICLDQLPFTLWLF